MSAIQKKRSQNKLTVLNKEFRNNQVENLSEQLQAKQQELDQFAQIVSHDLKTPLSGIVALAELLLMEYEEQLDEQASDWIKMMLDRSHNLAQMINGIYEFANADKVESTVNTFNVEKLVLEVVQSLSLKNNFEIHLPDNYPTVTCYYGQLSKILTHLFDNAIKFHHQEAGKISLVIKEVDDDQLLFSVIDDGPGIPEEFHELIFVVFKTAGDEQPKDGSGIGLTIVKKLVEHNGGQIGLNSKPGEGSEFWFTWPKQIT